MLVLIAHSFLSQQMSSWFILWLHFILQAILFINNLIFEIFPFFLKFIIKITVSLELFGKLNKKRMFCYVGESHSFFAINYKYLFEEVLNVFVYILKFLFFAKSIWQTKERSASTNYFCLHVMTLFIKNNIPLKGYSANNMK